MSKKTAHKTKTQTFKTPKIHNTKAPPLKDFFSGLITSKTRIKLLVRFFSNPETSAYLRGLAEEFNVSSNAIREELNQLSESQLLVSSKSGRQVNYRANRSHPLFPELKSMVMKVMGIDKVIDGVVHQLGKVDYAYLIDDYAQGKDTGIIDLVLVGDINAAQLNDLSKVVEQYIKRKIRTLVLTPAEFADFAENLQSRPHLMIWQANETIPGH